MESATQQVKTRLSSNRVLCILLVVLVCIFAYQKTRTPIVGIPDLDINSKVGNDTARLFWEDTIDRIGGVAAYAVFRNHYASSSPQTQHTAAHIFGGSLFVSEGLAGLVACDSSYSFGCYHEFLGRAIEKNGLSGVNELNQACFDALGSQGLSCSHGLGHGIQSYLGYSDEALIKSLAVCGSLQLNDPIGGCFGGVFMEYNTRTMNSFSGMSSRTLKDGGIFHPCSFVPKEREEVCYYWQPQWWSQIFQDEGKSIDVVFAKIGELCRGLKSNLRENCFSGAGAVVGISSGYDVQKSSALCDIGSPDANERAYCKTSAASSFFSEQSVRSVAPQLCKEIKGAWYERCMQSAAGTSGEWIDWKQNR